MCVNKRHVGFVWVWALLINEMTCQNQRQTDTTWGNQNDHSLHFLFLCISKKKVVSLSLSLSLFWNSQNLAKAVGTGFVELIEVRRRCWGLQRGSSLLCLRLHGDPTRFTPPRPLSPVISSTAVIPLPLAIPDPTALLTPPLSDLTSTSASEVRVSSLLSNFLQSFQLSFFFVVIGNY